jgi:hypothetical protein
MNADIAECRGEVADKGSNVARGCRRKFVEALTNTFYNGVPGSILYTFYEYEIVL